LILSLKILGEQTIKNISTPARACKLLLEDIATKPMSSVTEKPSIAVLPFDNLSGDPEQEYFSDGVTEDIITALSRIRQFFVIARNTTFAYKGQAVDVKAVARELGVRYVLEGSVRKAGSRALAPGTEKPNPAGKLLPTRSTRTPDQEIYHLLHYTEVP
jgi:adenylate cyclase